MHALNKLPYGKLDSKALGVRCGVLFLTYSGLIAASEKGRSRLQQVVAWCGPDYDGLLVFDECHKAKNLVPEAGGQPTRTGEAVLELQVGGRPASHLTRTRTRILNSNSNLAWGFRRSCLRRGLCTARRRARQSRGTWGT